MINLKFLTVLVSFCFIGLGGVAQATTSANFVASNDTTKNIKITANNSVKIIRNEGEIILRKGAILEVDLGDDAELSQVRIHSSLGRLVKHFPNVSKKVSMNTQKLLPGVYLIIIKKKESREIRKFILTD